MKLSIEAFVYGATDGAVTTFAVVAGVVGAGIISIDYFDIGICKFIRRWLFDGNRKLSGSKSQKEYMEKERRREEWEIDNLVEQEKQEIRISVQRKGLRLNF